MTAFGDLDVTTMKELPKGRTPIKTYRVPEENPSWMSRLWQRAQEEVESGGRVYVVVPRINKSEAEQGPIMPSVEETAARLKEEPSLSGINIGIVHGQSGAAENADVLQDFAAGVTPLLIATTVVEVGVDVP